MSVNRKGGNAIVGLLLAHGEKLGIALVALLAGWLVYGSLQYQGVDKQPNELTTIANAAQQNIEGFGWSDALNEEEGAKLSEDFKARDSVMVDPELYAVASNGFNPSILPRTVLRPDPPLLPAQSLTVSAGTELMGFNDEDYARGQALEELREERRKRREQEEQRQREDARNGRGRPGPEETEREVIVASGPRGGASVDEDDKQDIISYAIVLAKVPALDQTMAFRKALKGASGFNKVNDQPEYLGYYVERRPVAPGRVGDWSPVLLRNTFDNERLDAVDARTIEITTLDWVEDLEEIAAKDYLAEGLTFPLPPLIGRDWGPEVVHPEVPLQAEVELREDREDRNDRRGGRLGSGNRSRRDSAGFTRSRDSEEDLAALAAEEEEVDLLYPESFVMLRFFDMTVKPGRQYQYRVRLVLRDPNAEISRSLLAKEVLDRFDEKPELLPDERIRLSPWSDPTPVVSIPQPGGVLLSSVEPPRSEAFNTEPSVRLVVDAFDVLDSETVPSAVERPFQRGGVANFRGVDVPVIKAGRRIEEAEEFNFRTDLTILDIAGGQQLGREQTIPSAILLMDASGRMSVRSELDDSEDAQAKIDRFSGEEDNGRSTPSAPSGDFLGGPGDFF